MTKLDTKNLENPMSCISDSYDRITVGLKAHYCQISRQTWMITNDHYGKTGSKIKSKFGMMSVVQRQKFTEISFIAMIVSLKCLG